MGGKNSSELQPDEIAEIQQDTGFTFNQIVKLHERFSSLDKRDRGVLCREDFLRIPELTINPLGDRIVNAFFFNRRGLESEEVDFHQFATVLATFRPVERKDRALPNAINSRENKIRFAFKMYDLDEDNKISNDELLAVLHMMVGANISEEQLMNIVDKTISEADSDGDRSISFEEFCQAIERTDVEQKMSIRFLH